MKPLRPMPVLLAVIMVAVSSGCAHKKTPLVMPQEQPPAIAPTPTPTPQATAQQPPAQATPQPSPSPQPSPEQTETVQKPKPRTKHAGGRKPSPSVPGNTEKGGTETAHNVKPKIIENGNLPPATNSTAATVVSQEQAGTEQLLQNTENAINGIKRQLTQNEQAMLAQIRDFISQSRDAIKKNDLASARKLAVKAHLFSDELLKQR
jgi:outer membrane biosynthesis protein TonB